MAERIKAYSGFFVAAGNARAVITGQGTNKKIVDARNVVWEALTLVALVGDDDTLNRARALLRVVSAIAFDGASFNAAEWDQLIEGFIRSSRLELIPPRNMDS